MAIYPAKIHSQTGDNESLRPRQPHARPVCQIFSLDYLGWKAAISCEGDTGAALVANHNGNFGCNAELSNCVREVSHIAATP